MQVQIYDMEKHGRGWKSNKMINRQSETVNVKFIYETIDMFMTGKNVTQSNISLNQIKKIPHNMSIVFDGNLTAPSTICQVLIFGIEINPQKSFDFLKGKSLIVGDFLDVQWVDELTDCQIKSLNTM